MSLESWRDSFTTLCLSGKSLSCVIHIYVSIPAKPFIPCGPTAFAPGEPFSPDIPLRPTNQSQKYLHNVIQNFNKSTNVSNDNHQMWCLPSRLHLQRNENVKAYPVHQGTLVSQTPLCSLVDPEGLGIQVVPFPLGSQALLVVLLVPGWALAFDSSRS